MISVLEKTCAEYTSGGLTRDQAGRALIIGMILDMTGKDLGVGAIPDLIADADVPADSRASRLLSFFTKAAEIVERLRASLPLHVAVILSLLGLMVLINIHHLEYIIKKLSFALMGPGVAILLPFGVVKALALFMRIDTTSFFLAFTGIEEFARNLVPFVANILPFIVLRTFTASIILAGAVLFASGLALRIFGVAALKLWKEEKEGVKKEQKEKGKKDEPGKEPSKEKEREETQETPEKRLDEKALEADAPEKPSQEAAPEAPPANPPQEEPEEQQEDKESAGKKAEQEKEKPKQRKVKRKAKKRK